MSKIGSDKVRPEPVQKIEVRRMAREMGGWDVQRLSFKRPSEEQIREPRDATHLT